MCCVCIFFFFFQAEDGIRDAQESRGLGDVYKRQTENLHDYLIPTIGDIPPIEPIILEVPDGHGPYGACLLYTSDAADDLLCVDLGGRRILNKKTP